MKKTPLKRKKGINPVTDKQREKNARWKKITDEKCEELDYVCQWCGGSGQREIPEAFNYLDGHHAIKRRFNINTKKNCYVCHRKCHREIEDRSIDVLVYPTREAWLIKGVK